MKMKKILIVLLLLTGIIAQAQKSEREMTYKEGDVEFHMKMFYMLIFIRGDQSESFSDKQLFDIQNEHLAHINKMAEAGAVVIAGPFDGDNEKRGILIFDVDTEAEVIEWMKGDPYIQNGRLTYEILPWWTEKGKCLF
jgi:uncharacterized protein YciI